MEAELAEDSEDSVMLHSCGLVLFVCAATCLTFVSLFSDRWMLMGASVERPGGSANSSITKGTVFVAMGLWETKRVPFFHFSHHRHTYPVLVYHELAEQRRRRRSEVLGAAAGSASASATAVEVSDPRGKSSGIRANWRSFGASGQPTVSEATLKRLADIYSSYLKAMRVLLFVSLALCLGATVKLTIAVCLDASFIRHRYKERVLAYTLAGLCGIAFLLSVITWSMFLGTLYRAVISEGETAQVLNAGFFCCVLAGFIAAIAAIMAAWSINAEDMK